MLIGLGFGCDLLFLLGLKIERSVNQSVLYNKLYHQI